MEVLFLLLAAVSRNPGSKMDIDNLATVIAPNICYSKEKENSQAEMFSANKVVYSLLEEIEEYCTVN